MTYTLLSLKEVPFWETVLLEPAALPSSKWFLWVLFKDLNLALNLSAAPLDPRGCPNAKLAVISSLFRSPLGENSLWFLHYSRESWHQVLGAWADLEGTIVTAKVLKPCDRWAAERLRQVSSWTLKPSGESIAWLLWSYGGSRVAGQAINQSQRAIVDDIYRCLSSDNCGVGRECGTSHCQTSTSYGGRVLLSKRGANTYSRLCSNVMWLEMFLKHKHNSANKENIFRNSYWL